MAAEESPTNLVIATAYIPQHVSAALTVAMTRTPDPWRVVTHRICPVVARRAAMATDEMVAVSAITAVHRHLDVCVADEPERLALAMVSIDPVVPLEPPRRLAAL